jgi:hypothetical protein
VENKANDLVVVFARGEVKTDEGFVIITELELVVIFGRGVPPPEDTGVDVVDVTAFFSPLLDCDVVPEFTGTDTGTDCFVLALA